MINNVLAYDSSDPKVKIEGKNRKEKVSHEITCGRGPLQCMAVTSLNLLSKSWSFLINTN